MKVFRVIAAPLPALLLTPFGAAVKAADEVLAAGTPASDFTLSSQEGKTVNLREAA